MFSERQTDIHRDGVAIILDKDTNSVLPVDEQLITARFVTAHAKVTITQCYAPPNNHDDYEKDSFYEQQLIDKIPHHNITIVMGDTNAQIDGDRSGFKQVLESHAFVKRTENGNRFVQFCAMNNLMIGSTLFEHKDIHKIT